MSQPVANDVSAMYIPRRIAARINCPFTMGLHRKTTFPVYFPEATKVVDVGYDGENGLALIIPMIAAGGYG